VWRLTGIGFGRLDADDARRTHLDLRELGVTYLGHGVVGVAVVGNVFWGVTEVHHLVDIINQTDGVAVPGWPAPFRSATRRPINLPPGDGIRTLLFGGPGRSVPSTSGCRSSGGRLGSRAC